MKTNWHGFSVPYKDDLEEFIAIHVVFRDSDFDMYEQIQMNTQFHARMILRLK